MYQTVTPDPCDELCLRQTVQGQKPIWNKYVTTKKCGEKSAVGLLVPHCLCMETRGGNLAGASLRLAKLGLGPGTPRGAACRFSQNNMSCLHSYSESALCKTRPTSSIRKRLEEVFLTPPRAQHRHLPVRRAAVRQGCGRCAEQLTGAL